MISLRLLIGFDPFKPYLCLRAGAERTKEGIWNQWNE
jgi:hypothetical protein